MTELKWITPPALQPGDTVTVIAPSGPFDTTLGWVGLGFLKERYRVQFDRAMFTPTGYLAGTDERRASELRRALVDPGVRAVLAARGGYGAHRISNQVDWSELRRNPKWIVGFSDITALHVEAARVRVASLHAANVASLGRAHHQTRASFIGALERSAQTEGWQGLRSVRSGTARGRLLGGNLTLLHAAAAAGRLDFPPESVVLLEDVTERPYRIDRMLTTLTLGGHFKNVAAFVLGDFTDCGPKNDGVTADAVLEERLSHLGVPVVAGAPVGHGNHNEPVVLGRWVELCASSAEASVRFLPLG